MPIDSPGFINAGNVLHCFTKDLWESPGVEKKTSHEMSPWSDLNKGHIYAYDFLNIMVMEIWLMPIDFSGSVYTGNVLHCFLKDLWESPGG